MSRYIGIKMFKIDESGSLSTAIKIRPVQTNANLMQQKIKPIRAMTKYNLKMQEPQELLAALDLG